MNPQLARSQALECVACGFTPVSSNPLGALRHACRTCTDDYREAHSASVRTQVRDPVEVEQDAFRLFGGMGPCMYVTRSGEFLIGADPTFDEPVLRSASDDEAIESLVIGSLRLALPELLELVPSRPGDAGNCPVCKGQRWHPIRSIAGAWPIAICTACHGRGWAG